MWAMCVFYFPFFFFFAYANNTRQQTKLFVIILKGFKLSQAIKIYKVYTLFFF